MTEQEYKSLIPIEAQLFTASQANYAHGCTKEILDMCADLVDKYIGKVARNYVCNRCKLEILKKLAPLYFKHKEALDAQKITKVNNTTKNKKGGKK